MSGMCIWEFMCSSIEHCEVFTRTVKIRESILATQVLSTVYLHDNCSEIQYVNVLACLNIDISSLSVPHS